MLNRYIFNSVVFLLLLVGSYVFVEKPELDRYRKKNIKQRPFLSLNIQSIRINAGRLNFKNGHWLMENSSDLKIDQIHVNEFISRLKKLKVIKDVDVGQFLLSWHEFSLVVDNREIKVFVGEKQQFSERYYLRMEKGGRAFHYLVEDSSPQKEAIPDELFNINPLKRQKVISFINKTKLQLVDTRIYLNESKNLHIQRRSGKQYTINISTGEVQYSVGKNFRTNKRNIRDWKNGITQIKPVQLLKEINMSELRELGATAGLGKNGETNLNIYLRSDGKIVARERSENFYRIYKDEHLKFLLPNYQDFILKNILGDEIDGEFEVVINTDFDLQKKLSAEIKNDQLFITSKEVEKKKMKNYGRVIESLFDEADYVNWGREMTINPEKKIDLQINKRKLIIGHAHGMIEVFDEAQEISYFYRDNILYKNLEKL